MGTALVATIDLSTSKITLDPAVRVGTRLAEFGNAVLLHATSAGHCRETAVVLARALRSSGWKVEIAAFDDLEPLRDNEPTRPGLVGHDLLAALCASIGPAPGAQYRPPVPKEKPQPKPRGSKHAPKTRQRCRVCLHVTIGQGVASHVRNIGHDDWERVLVLPDGAVTRAPTQEGSPEASGSPSSASD